MLMRIDEPRGDHFAGGVDDDRAGGRLAAVVRCPGDDRLDLGAADVDIAGEARGSGAVHHHPAGDDQIHPRTVAPGPGARILGRCDRDM